MGVLSNLKPERVFEIFEDICKIPHGSENTEQISEFCVDFAHKNGLYCIKDGMNNVIIKKPGYFGYENHPTVILQGHLDMVCQKTNESKIDFLKDGLILKRDADKVFADGTTLGADDGIAVAMILALFEDKNAVHPPLEAVFTVDEEIGMFGADGIDASNLNGKILLNIDSEEEGVFIVSCAGGVRFDVTLPFVTEKVEMPVYELTLSGLKGGHSGMEINKGRYNSNKLLGEFFKTLSGEFCIGKISGGEKENVIANHTVCTVATFDDLNKAAEKFVNEKYNENDADFNIDVKPLGNSAQCMNKTSSLKFVNLLNDFPYGIISMVEGMENMAQTSLNLGVLSTENNKILLRFSLRSSAENELDRLIERLEKTANTYNAEYELSGRYPAWEYRKNSLLRDVMVNVYEEMYGKKPIVSAVHAGLECGIFSNKISGLDVVSFGPDLLNVHTVNESMSISSVKRTYEFLLNVLKCL